MPVVTPQQTSSWVQANFAGALSRLRQLVELPSHTLQLDDVARCQNNIADVYRQLGMEVQLHPAAERAPILTATTAAVKDSPVAILLVGHADIFQSPESPIYKSGLKIDTSTRASGPGCYDMKAGLVTIETALSCLKELGVLDQLPIKVIINSAEENSSQATRDFMRGCAQKDGVALVFEFGKGDSVLLERAGAAAFKVEVQGQTAHMNQFFKGRNAVIALSDFNLEVDSFNQSGQPFVLNVGPMQGGLRSTQVPGEASAELQLRYHGETVFEEVVALIEKTRASVENRRACAITVRLDKKIGSSPVTEASKALLAEWRTAGLEAGVDLKLLPRIWGMTDGNHLTAQGMGCIDGLGPNGGNAHEDTEWLDLASWPSRILTTVNFLRGRLASPKPADQMELIKPPPVEAFTDVALSESPIAAEFRPMTVRDIAKVRGFLSSMIKKGVQGVQFLDWETDEVLRRAILKNPGFSQIANVGDKVIAVCFAGDNGLRSAITHLIVDPEYQRQGIGRAIVEKTLPSFLKAGVLRLIVGVTNDNTNAQEFWLKMGFRMSTERGGKVVYMTRDLKA